MKFQRDLDNFKTACIPWEMKIKEIESKFGRFSLTASRNVSTLIHYKTRDYETMQDYEESSNFTSLKSALV